MLICQDRLKKRIFLLKNSAVLKKERVHRLLSKQRCQDFYTFPGIFIQNSSGCFYSWTTARCFLGGSWWCFLRCCRWSLFCIVALLRWSLKDVVCGISGQGLDANQFPVLASQIIEVATGKSAASLVAN